MTQRERIAIAKVNRKMNNRKAFVRFSSRVMDVVEAFQMIF